MPPTTQHDRVLGLDVMRSAAILLVIAAHCANNMSYWFGITPPSRLFFAGGLGVDLFFALSGFLIGRILIEIVARGASLRLLLAFLARRWLRTLPAYMTWLLTLAVLFPPAEGLPTYLLRFATLTQNLLQPMPADYWFAVSWSLTVEEWFYLCFGSGVVLCATTLRRRWALWLPLAALLAGPLLLRASAGPAEYYDAGYWKMVPYRLDEIGYGVIFAWLHARDSVVFRRPWLALALGLGLVGSAWFALLPIPFRAFVVLESNMTVLGCALCIPAALRLRGAPGWLAAPARHLSRLAYTLYLVHLTIIVDVAQALWWQQRISAPVAVVVAVLGMAAAAEALSRCIEQPFMRRRPPQFPRALAPAVAAT